MGAVVVLGERSRVQPWALGGAVVVAADSAGEVRQAWSGLRGSQVAVVLLTPGAARSLAAELATAGGADAPLVAVLPA